MRVPVGGSRDPKNFFTDVAKGENGKRDGAGRNR